MAQRQNEPPVMEFERPVVELERKIEELRQFAQGSAELAREIKVLQTRVEELQREIFADLTPWQTVLLSRHPGRPYTQDYLARLVTDFLELHGDRHFGDDPAIVGGLGWFDGTPVLVLGHQKGRTTKENVMRNYGMPKPEGYRKALRLMQLAARFKRPIFVFFDTSVACPGVAAEERGKSEAFAKIQEVMSSLPDLIVCAVIGEGGSGGALSLGVAVRFRMLV